MTDQSKRKPESFDAIIVGAGFSGLYALYRLRGLGFSVRVLERGDGVGGTWFWNRYPGARCDTESVDYSYSFSKELRDEWEWTERYPTQPEILRYLNHVADRFDLCRDVQLDTEVVSAHYRDCDDRWMITTAAGEVFSARWCVMCVGCLSKVKPPEFPGLERYRGDWYHTARWPPSGVNFSGRTAAVVGTGSTGIQLIPQMARQAERLYVLQRTPNYSMPAHNHRLDPEYLRDVRRHYTERRRFAEQQDAGVPLPAPTRATFDVSAEERTRIYEAGWQRGGINALLNAFTDIFTSAEANEAAAAFARRKIREIVRDPDVAEALSPSAHIGTKRTCVDIGYYESYNRDNVELVDLRREPIQTLTERGIRTSAAEYDVDCIVFAIGFDAITGALLGIDIRGVEGRTLSDHWADGPRAYLGLSSAGFPNLFMVTGPGSPSVLTNMVVSIEQHVDWISECLAALRGRGVKRIAAMPEAEQGWVDHVAELADATLFPVANSWFVGANIPGKPRTFMPYVGGCGRYRRRCDEVAARGYEGFELSLR